MGRIEDEERYYKDLAERKYRSTGQSMPQCVDCTRVAVATFGTGNGYVNVCRRHQLERADRAAAALRASR